MNAIAKTAATTTTLEQEPGAAVLAQILDRVDAIAAQQSRPSPIKLTTWAEIERFAEKAAKSGMVPKDYVGKPDAIVIAVMMGAELGLAPMQALQNIAVVNGRPSVWGDALPALCRAAGVAKSIREWSEGDGDAVTYHCEAIRRDDPNPVHASFSVADAKRANLWKETPKVKKQGRDGPYEVDSGPWYSYPKRMLQMRARGFCLRDAFPDVLKGLITAEEAGDIPFEATGLTPTAHHEPTLAAPDPTPKGPTIKEWLDALQAEFDAAPDAEAVDAIISRDKVQKALDTFHNGAKTRLDDMIQNALACTTPPPTEADPFPGGTP